MAKELSKGKEKSKKTIYESIKENDINTNAFDDDEQENPDENIDEEDNSQKEIERSERNNITNDTPYVIPRKIHHDILKTNKGYKITTTTKDTIIIRQIQHYLDSFPTFIELTKERIEGCFVRDEKQNDYFLIDKNINPYHNIMLPNGEIIPLINLIRKGGGRVPKNIQKYREYRAYMLKLKEHFEKINDFFEEEDFKFIENNLSEKYEYMLLNLVDQTDVGNPEEIKEFAKNSEMVQIELDELYNYVKGDKT